MNSADPHSGNLLKVLVEAEESGHYMKSARRGRRRKRLRRKLRKILGRESPSEKQLAQIGYLDFGLLSNVDESVRDGLVCSVVQLVFAQDVEGVTRMFGELQLLPPEIVDDDREMRALAAALNQTFKEVLIYPEAEEGDTTTTTQVPALRFDKLLDALARLIPRFQFDLPPYFLNNARALSTLEGIARSLDPSFSVLQVVYPYALNRLLRNPSNSRVVDKTVQNLIRDPTTGLYDDRKISKLLDDSALITGYKRRKVAYDIMKTRGGRRIFRMIIAQKVRNKLFPPRKRRSF